MSKVKLDLSKMKHVRSDDKTTTLRHPNGHEITLAHSALSPVNRAQLQALSKSAQMAETPLQSEERRDQMKMADGGILDKVQEGIERGTSALLGNGFTTHVERLESPEGQARLFRGEPEPVPPVVDWVNKHLPDMTPAIKTITDMRSSAHAPGFADGGKVDYQGEHKPLKSKGLHEAEEHEMAGRGGSPEQDEMSFKIIRSVKGKPDEVVAIHRSVPEHVNEINPGDWVSINKDYADLYGHIKHGGKHKVISKEVPAKDLHVSDSIHEQGYHPEKKADGGVISINRRKYDRSKDESKSHKEARDLYKAEGNQSKSMFHAKMAEYHQHLMHGRHAEAAQAKAEAEYHEGMPDQYAQGGKVKMYAEGTEDGKVSADDTSPIYKQISQKYQAEADAEIAAQKAKEAEQEAQKQADRVNFEQRLEQENPVTQATAPLKAARAPASVPAALAPAVQQPPQAPQPSAAVPAAPPSSQSTVAPPPPAAPSPQLPQGNLVQQMAGQQMPQGLEGTLNEAYRLGTQGIQKQAELNQAQGAEMANVQQQAIAHQKEIMDAWQRNRQEMEQERQAFMQDIKDGYIDPEKYWTGDKEGRGGHSRFMAALGILLAGFNPTKNPNAAIDYINKDIDRNVKAQELNLTQKNNLYRFNLDRYKNERDAMDATRLMYNDMAIHQLEGIKAKYAGSGAAAEADRLQSQLLMQYMPIKEKLEIRKTIQDIMNSSGTDANKQEQMIKQLGILAPEAAKEMAAKSIPGMAGFAARDIPPEVVKQVEGHRKLDTALNDLQKWVEEHSTVLGKADPTKWKDYNIGKAKALMVQQMLRDPIFGGGVYKEGEQPLFDELVKSGNVAGLFKNVEILPQLKNLKNTNEMMFRDTLKSYAPQIEQNLPKQQAAPLMKRAKDGKLYMKDPKTGKAILVE